MKLSLAVWWSTIVMLLFWYEYKTAILISTSALSFHNELGFLVSNPILIAIGYENDGKSYGESIKVQMVFRVVDVLRYQIEIFTEISSPMENMRLNGN